MMSAIRLRFSLLIACALTLLPGAIGLPAAEPTNGHTLIVTNLGPSPVQQFRELLAMDSRSRAINLDLRPPGMREPIEAKINQYLALPADEREARLQATELRHYLTLLLPLPNRSLLVTQIAEPMRSVVEARLAKWDIMPPPMREEVLENERVIGYFAQLGTMTSKQREELLKSMTAEQRAKLEADIQRWRTLSDVDRKQTFAQFTQIFNLTAEEREKTLSYLSDSERETMEATLETFAGLTPDQRKICIQSFQKFASMSPVERQEFLKKAAAWQHMTPAEREQWREVVRAVPDLPPLPPGFFPAVATTVTPSAAKTNSTPAGKTTNGG